MNESTKYLKVLADGSQVPASDPRTDHVAVLDTTRNLLIHPHSIGVNGEPAPLAKLLTALVHLDVLGGGWKLATREEAESILDLSRFNPAVDPNLFPGIKPRGHITATPAAWAPVSTAWWVNLFSGDVDVSVTDAVNDSFALAVRPAGQYVEVSQ